VLINRQPKEMMPRLWSLCDISLVPLKNSDLFRTVIPSKIFECMGMGIPTLMSVPEGEATGIIQNTNSGLTVDSENVDQIVEGILKLKNDSELYNELRQSSIDVASQFSRDLMAEKMLSIFSNLEKSKY
jgi:glycosyltransferase involved in cell wall biosynthesis